ncbi:jg23080 [Pararge aegeria aegeria]|uniref:Jg23080 protein n=1 Tax=Pararge aegeria aegeria TaxID=348720 RepID=A0A8S4S674_9NEOP|nr:jg23080 [Pararge aegeria aegeria]
MHIAGSTVYRTWEPVSWMYEHAGITWDSVPRNPTHQGYQRAVEAFACMWQVAQDTAYWELKEKLSQVKGDHERLQQNMLELQMQYETLSGRHQDELRHRPETLNKFVYIYRVK